MGEVRDQSGAVAPTASVTATNTATNLSRTTRTNEAGIYSFPALAPGPYQINSPRRTSDRFGTSGPAPVSNAGPPSTCASYSLP